VEIQLVHSLLKIHDNSFVPILTICGELSYGAPGPVRLTGRSVCGSKYVQKPKCQPQSSNQVNSLVVDRMGSSGTADYFLVIVVRVIICLIVRSKAYTRYSCYTHCTGKCGSLSSLFHPYDISYFHVTLLVLFPCCICSTIIFQ
jgi:hypothetical protein